MNLFRALTDNDRRWQGEDFYRAGLTQLKYHVRRFETHHLSDRVVRVDVALDVLGSKGRGFRHACTYTILSNGWIGVANRLEPVGELPPLLRLGVKLEIDGAFTNLEWFGRGPHESYPDRKAGAALGRYRGAVAEQFVPYPMPQETGSKEDVRWAALTDDAGAGLLVVAEERLAVTALHFTAEDLERAKHPHELRPRRNVQLALDWRQGPLGNASCGPPPLEKYILRAQPCEFAFWLRPVAPALGDLAELARQTCSACSL